jgi:hypothetical protein
MNYDTWKLATPPNMEVDFESTVTFCWKCGEYYEEDKSLDNFNDLGIIIENEICTFCSEQEQFLNH